MTEVTHPPGWWLASDGNWYAPHLHPGAVGPLPPPAGPTPFPESASPWTPPLPQLPQFAPFTAGPGSAPSITYGYAANPYAANPYAALTNGPPGYGYPPSAPKTNGLAITSLILSIVCLAGLGSIAGIILGFVSRRQIRRSWGTQRGAGLGLAGIIVGFVTLALVLAAVAIPTFLGVTASHAPVTRLAPIPIALGTAQQGGAAGPMTWGPATLAYDTSVDPVPGGVDVSIPSPEHAVFVAAPVRRPFPSIQESASVAITAGPTTNGVGLGCMSEDQSDQLAFFVRSSGVWQIVEWSAHGDGVVDTGVSPAVHSAGTNDVTVACRDDLARAGTTELSFEINGTPVADDLLALSSPEWLPTVQLCSCGGADTGQFLGVAYYSSPDTPGTSA
jgi:hypothetical protein